MAVMRPRLSFNPGFVHYPGVRQRRRRAPGSLPNGIAPGSRIARAARAEFGTALPPFSICVGGGNRRGRRG
jgi:hypothetical protein